MSITSDNFKQSFELIYKNIIHTKLQFILYDKYQKKYLKNNTIENSLIFDSLKNTILVKLAKILDIDCKKEAITIFYILNMIQSNKEINNENQELIKYVTTVNKYIRNECETLKKIKTIRDKNIVYLDKKYRNGYSDLKVDNNLLPNEIDEITSYLLGVINTLKFKLYNENSTYDNLLKELLDEIANDKVSNSLN